MRVGEEILGTVDRREADVERIEPLRQFCDVPLPDDPGGARNDPPARQDAIGRGAQVGIIEEFSQAELAAKALPMAFSDDADEDTLAASGLEDVVDRPRMLALRHRARLVAGYLVFDHVLGNQEQAILEQTDTDVGAVPFSPALLIERREDR